MEFVPIKRSLSRLTEKFSINFYGDDSVPGDLSQLSGVDEFDYSKNIFWSKSISNCQIEFSVQLISHLWC